MIKASVIGASGLLLLSVAYGQAGPCTDEINSVSKMMASHDAGSGPTAGAGSSQSTTQSGDRATQQHPPAAVMGKETEGRAASPQDVQRQTAGQPTAAEQPNQSMSHTAQPAASAALSRARTLDQQGNEAECMSAVQQAKQALESR